MDEDILAQFSTITGSSPALAAQYVGIADGNLEGAIELFYANEGADLQTPTQPSQPPPIPPPSTRPLGHGPGYQDGDGVVHLDSDSEEQQLSGGDEDEVVFAGHNPRQMPATETSSRGTHTPSTSVPPSTHPTALEDDEAMARRLQEEFYGEAGAGNGQAGMVDEHGYRAPIGRTTETLVGPGSFDVNDPDEMRAAVMEQMMARRQPRPPRDRPGIFNQAGGSIWNRTDAESRISREQLARATAGASEASSKANTLAEMYRPPFELMSRLPWDQARDEGKENEKWIIVNIQDQSIFDCQVLNRDIWKNPGVMETVKENFIFMQYSKDDARGHQYIQYYFQNKDTESAYPHIAIVDPRTGEQVKVWSGPPVPKPMDFLMQLHEFLDRYSLKATAKNPVARRKPEVRKETQVERMTEEQQMEMAMQASLAGTMPEAENDPDYLTRSVSNLDQDKGKGKADDELEDSMEATEPPHTNGAPQASESAFASISSSNPHIEPPNGPDTTRIQFRHPTGRVVRRFALSDPVSRIYEWLKASPLEGNEGLEFELIFMQKNLIEVLDESVDHAGLKNATIMVEIIDGES